MKTGFGIAVLLAALLALIMTPAAHAKNREYYTGKAKEFFNGDESPLKTKKNTRKTRTDRMKNKSNYNEDRTVETGKKNNRKKSRRGGRGRAPSDTSSAGVND